MIRAIAVDDEPLALSVIETFCKKIPFIELVATFPSGIEAMSYLSSENIDLMFLDINMPHISGIEMLRSMSRPPIVIMTTAYQDYALEGFELSVLDYLVKPFSFERFFKSVNRANELCTIKQKAEQEAAPKASEDEGDIFVKVDYSVVKIASSDIVMVEGLKDYVKIYTQEKRYITKSTMKNIEERLSQYGFMRVHKSYIINPKYVTAFENNHIILPTGKVALGNQYKDLFVSFIEQSKL